MSIEKIEEYLDDFDCTETEKAEILKCHSNNDIKGMIALLRKHRQTILSRIHNEEKQISSLDYFVFQLERDIKAQ